MKNRTLLCLLAALGVLAFPMGGCIFSPDNSGGGGTTPPPTQSLQFPDSADKLMQNYKTVYEGMQITPYRDEVLSRAYKFLLQDQTVEQFGLPDNVYDYEEDVAIQTKMFSGQPSSTGKVISNIEVSLLQPQGVWQDIQPTDPNYGGYPHGQYRRYDVQIYFHVQGENLQYSVHGPVIFYVTARDSTYQGNAALYYQLLGQQDLTASN